MGASYRAPNNRVAAESFAAAARRTACTIQARRAATKAARWVFKLTLAGRKADICGDNSCRRIGMGDSYTGERPTADVPRRERIGAGVGCVDKSRRNVTWPHNAPHAMARYRRYSRRASPDTRAVYHNRSHRLTVRDERLEEREHLGEHPGLHGSKSQNDQSDLRRLVRRQRCGIELLPFADFPFDLR
jgi:hypothetical protein